MMGDSRDSTTHCAEIIFQELHIVHTLIKISSVQAKVWCYGGNETLVGHPRLSEDETTIVVNVYFWPQQKYGGAVTILLCFDMVVCYSMTVTAGVLLIPLVMATIHNSV